MALDIMLSPLHFCTIVAFAQLTGLTYALPPVSTSNETTLAPGSASLTSPLFSGWPRIPFEALASNIVIQFLSCSPAEDADRHYAHEIILTVIELEEWFLNYQPSSPVGRVHHDTGQVVVDVRPTSDPLLTRMMLGFILEIVRSLFSIHGPASVSARLLLEGTQRIGSFSLFVPFSPSTLEQ